MSEGMTRVSQKTPRQPDSVPGTLAALRAGLGNSPRTILEELGRIQSADVVVPLVDEVNRELRICCVVRPDKMQAALLDRLGLRLPERLKTPSAMLKM